MYWTFRDKKKLSDYFIFVKCDDAIKLMTNKIINSSVLSGKQTSFYYETRYYLKYLQFLLSMKNSKLKPLLFYYLKVTFRQRNKKKTLFLSRKE